ncbi:MAG: DUF4369 domain-containing protein [Prevotella sp.]
MGIRMNNKKRANNITFILTPVAVSLFVFFLIPLLSSCGGKSGHFRIVGRFRSFNQGEFYIYNPLGVIADIDTIKVADGRFAYEIPLEDKSTFIIVFPNYSEQVVFGEPGAVVSMKGDASHLKEMEISGTDDNKKMTNFRLNANKMSPPEIIEAAAKFVEENPTSPVSLYLVNKYFIQAQSPNHARAYRLVKLMSKENPDNIRIQRLLKQLEKLKSAAVGDKLPDFKAIDINGKRIDKSLMKGKVGVISAWATWNNDSKSMQRRLKVMEKKYGDKLALLSICLDARKKDCDKSNERDSISWNTICDGKMWDTPLLHTMGIATVPGNIVIDKNGTIVARNLDNQQLEAKVKKMLEH